MYVACFLTVKLVLKVLTEKKRIRNYMFAQFSLVERNYDVKVGSVKIVLNLINNLFKIPIQRLQLFHMIYLKQNSENTVHKNLAINVTFKIPPRLEHNSAPRFFSVLDNKRKGNYLRMIFFLPNCNVCIVFCLLLFFCCSLSFFGCSLGFCRLISLNVPLVSFVSLLSSEID